MPTLDTSGTAGEPDSGTSGAPTEATEGGSTAAGDVCGSGSQCLETVEGWTGPLAIKSEDWPGEPFNCGGAFLDEVYAGSVDLAPNEHECACDCIPPDADLVTCGPPVVYGDWDDPLTCMGTPGSTTVVANACQTVFQPFLFSTQTTIVQSTASSSKQYTCTEDSSGTVIEPAAFAESIVACGETDVQVADCSAGEVCASTPVAPYEGELCIVREGDNECPEDTDYTERRLAFGGVIDDRSCMDCDCGYVEGGCTVDGAMLFYSSDDCAGSPFTMHQELDCEIVTDGFSPSINSIQYFGSSPDPGFGCSPAEGTNDTQGSLSAADPTTVCCLSDKPG